jgi:catalase
VAGAKRRLRPESFADHYSQARQFYVSQTEVERKHIADAFTFELSKCDTETIRTRMVAGLRNVDEDLASAVAEGLGLREMPAPAEAARLPRHELPPSPALSIVSRGPRSFAGRKLGVLVTNGADAETLAALRAAASSEGVTVEVIAPTAGGVDISDGTRVRAGQQVDGAPSVLYDAVAIIAESGGARALAARPAARDFVTDAVAHCKFIGYTSGASVLLEASGLPADPAGTDEGFVSLSGLSGQSAAEFIARCRHLRHWHREFAAAG